MGRITSFLRRCFKHKRSSLTAVIPPPLLAEDTEPPHPPSPGPPPVPDDDEITSLEPPPESPRLLIEIIDIQLPEQIPDTRPRLPIPVYPSPPLPIEICEMILDFVAWSKKSSWDDPDLDRPALTRCALVCRAWLPRCRFQLRPDAVDLSSGSDAASLSRFYAAVPDAASTLKFLEIHGRKRGDTSTADSWVYSVPAILPPLPNLTLLNFYDIDLAHQQPALYKLYSAFSLSKPALRLSRVSIHDFSQVARLALATQTWGLVIGDCPPVSIDTLSPLLPRSVFLNTLRCVSRSWTDLSAMSSDWLLSCPNLYKLLFWLHQNEDTLSDPFAPKYAHTWSRFHDLFWRLHSRSVQPEKGIEIIIELQDVDIVLNGGIAGNHPRLCLRHHSHVFDTDTLKATSLVPAVLQALPLICSGDFPTVIIEIHLGPNWTWEDFTPETWKPIDNAPLHYYRSLTHFNVDIVGKIPYHDIFTPQYVCVENLKHVLFPRMAARATIERMCVDDDCSIHNAVRARKLMDNFVRRWKRSRRAVT